MRQEAQPTTCSRLQTASFLSVDITFLITISMATFKIPKNGQIRQLNQGDVYGELWSTKNIDLSSSPGKIRLARPTEELLDADGVFNRTIVGLTFFNQKIYAINETEIYADDSPFDTFVEVENGNDNAQDIVVFDGAIRISEQNEIAEYDGDSTYDNDWWTTVVSGTSLSSSVPHIMDVSYEGQETLAVTDGDKLRYYRTTGTVKHFTLNLLSNHIACSLTSGNSANWVGSYDTVGSRASVYEWNVGQDEFTQKYEIDARAVLAMTTLDNIPYLITERGEIQKFNQAGFTTIATLPMWNTPDFFEGVETGYVLPDNELRPVHPKGMTAYNGKILVYVNADDTDESRNVNERCLSGIWEIDPVTGSTTHRCSARSESRASRSAPILVVNDPNGRIYFGGRRDPAPGLGEEGLWREDLSDDATNYGYFVTTEMHGDSFIENFESIFLSAIQDSGDSIVVKYRESQDFSLPIYGSGTWLNTTSFTTEDDMTGLSVGDEVEVTVGTNSGRLSHVTNIETGASVTEITVEDAIGTAGEGLDFQCDNWIKIDDAFDTTQKIKEIKLNKPGTMYQFKVYLTGKNGYPLINRMVVKTNNKKPL